MAGDENPYREAEGSDFPNTLLTEGKRKVSERSGTMQDIRGMSVRTYRELR